MSASYVLLLAFLIGVIAGLRSLIAPAAVAWAAHGNWIDLHGSRLAFMGSTLAVEIFTLLASVELIGDKLPSTPSRTTIVGLTPRVALGGLAGAALAAAGMQSAALGAGLGVVGGIAGAFGGFQFRTRLVRAFGCRDFVIAGLEDVIAIVGALLIVSRF